MTLGAAFGTSAELWANLESNYRLALARQGTATTDDVARKARLYGLVPVGELIRRGWIKASKDIDDLGRNFPEPSSPGRARGATGRGSPRPTREA